MESGQGNCSFLEISAHEAVLGIQEQGIAHLACISKNLSWTHSLGFWGSNQNYFLEEQELSHKSQES